MFTNITDIHLQQARERAERLAEDYRRAQGGHRAERRRIARLGPARQALRLRRPRRRPAYRAR